METVSLNNREFYKKMLRIALPIAVQSLIVALAEVPSTVYEEQ